jgi:hypothetical protein
VIPQHPGKWKVLCEYDKVAWSQLLLSLSRHVRGHLKPRHVHYYLLDVRGGTHTGTQLTAGTYNRHILIAGGKDAAGYARSQVQKFDPSGGGRRNTSFTHCGSNRVSHQAAKLSGSSVLWIGGYDYWNNSSKHVYAWPAGVHTNMNWERTQFAAQTLPNGKVLVAGGWRSQAATPTLNEVELSASRRSPHARDTMKI